MIVLAQAVAQDIPLWAMILALGAGNLVGILGIWWWRRRSATRK
ncbi:hypothetical protein [Herpetosiphon llansteffanensis]|nr:hypothetical protein [Herpetosiphon llansteffanensis]